MANQTTLLDVRFIMGRPSLDIVRSFVRLFVRSFVLPLSLAVYSHNLYDSVETYSVCICVCACVCVCVCVCVCGMPSGLPAWGNQLQTHVS